MLAITNLSALLIIMVCVLNPNFSTKVVTAQETTQIPPCPAQNDLKPGTKFIRTYSALKDWSASIPEPMLPALSILFAIDLLRKRRRR